MNRTKMSWLTAASLAFGLFSLGACGGEEPENKPDLGGDEVNVAPLQAGHLRVAVVDSLTGRPVRDCKVVATVVGKTGTMDLPLQKNGRYEVSGINSSDQVAVSVFHDEYNYVTVAGLYARDLVIPARRLITSRRGGLSGTLETWPESNDRSTMAVGVAALALQGNILDFDQGSFLGDQIETVFKFPSWIDTLAQTFAPGSPSEYPLTVPGSVMMGEKSAFSVLGLPSPCDDADQEKSGSCGRQAAFSAYISVLGFTDPVVSELYSEEAKDLIQEVVSVVDEGAEFNLAAMLPKAIPLLPKILSHVTLDFVSDLEIPFGGADTPLLNQSFYPNRKMDQRLRVTVPETPQLMSKPHADLVGAIAIADKGSQGMVPMGLGSGVMDNGTGSFDVTLADGGIALQGAINRILAIALDSDISQTLEDRTRAPVFSAILHTVDGGFSSTNEASLKGSFLAAPSASAFDARTRTLSSLPDISGASLYRAEVKQPGRQWVIYFGGDQDSVTLPAVPGGLSDVVQPENDGHTMIAIALKDGIGLDELFTDSDVNESDLNDLMMGFSYAVHYDDEGAGD